MLNKKFFAAAFTLTGTIIGAGILGLPYVFSKSGFFIGAFWLILLGFVMLFVNLCLGEVSLRTKKIHHLPGYAEKYLGKSGKVIMFFAVIFGIYSALLAYLVGEGQSLSKLFFGTLDYSLYFAFAFWILMTLLLREGLKELKKIEFYGVMVIIGIIFTIFLWFIPEVNFSNLNHYDFSNLFFPFGVILFALLGFTSIPELRREIKGDEKLLKKAIILGTLIPVFLYFIFTLIFVGVLGQNIEQVATISFGSFITILGIFTMLTSYFVLSFSLKDIFIYDLKKKKLSFIFVSLIPFILYLSVTFFDFTNFTRILSVGGVISGGLTGILILLMNINSKKKGNRKSEFSVPINWFVIGILSLIFVFGIVVELF
jgi:tyrosine-specific transport protein|tara:strand:- start:2100 stop:3209 length:1110 start_codon:yes stop_codon:yes gene_type:complete